MARRLSPIPVIIAAIALALLLTLVVGTQAQAFPPPPGERSTPVTDADGWLYFLAGPSAGTEITVTASLYRQSVGSVDLTLQAIPEQVAPIVGPSQQQMARMYPAPGGAYLALVEPSPNSPAPHLAILEAAGGRELPIDAIVSPLSPLGHFLGWHPDGRHLLYADWYDRTGTWLLDAAGSETPHRLSSLVADAAAFSPDGATLAFSTRPGLGSEEPATLWLAVGAGEPSAVIERPAEMAIFGLSWSPDGHRLAFVLGGGELWVMGAGGENPHPLSRSYASGWDFPPPAWSPDGRLLAFSALESPVTKDDATAYSEAGAFRHANVHVVDAMTGAERSLVPGIVALYPAWSPDGARVAYVSLVDGDRQVYTARADGADLRPVSAAPGWRTAPAWLPQAPAPLAPPPDTQLPRSWPAGLPGTKAPPSSDQAAVPFLSTPYYGTWTMNSYFDHRYPTYGSAPNSTYNRVVRHDGKDLPDCGTVSWGTECIWYNGHDGYDFGMRYQPVIAAAAGRVIWAGWQNADCQNGPTCGYGLWVAIDHGNGYSTRYAHLTALSVSVGQQVRQGQFLGSTGNTGSSTGPHLHFSVHKSYRSVDPFGWTGSEPDPWQEYSGIASEFLWSDGQWVGHPTTAPETVNTLEVDDDDPAFTLGCQSADCPEWHTATGAGIGGSSRLTPVKSAPAYWARWSPELPAATYEVYLYVPAGLGTTRQANFALQLAQGSQKTIVDQYMLSNVWICLGEYELAPAVMPQVTVSDATGETDTTRQIAVDALRFVQRPVIYPSHNYLPMTLRRWPPAPYVPALNPIAPPGDLGTYTVSWSAAELAASYELQEARDSGFITPTLIYAGSKLSHAVASRGFETYYYRVRAKNQWGFSDWSPAEAVDVRWETESNNSLALANGPLTNTLEYYGYPNDWADYFHFNLEVSGTVTVALASHTGVGVQMSLYYGTPPVRVVRDSLAPFQIVYDGQPGPYYIYIYTGWGYNRSRGYTLRVTYP